MVIVYHEIVDVDNSDEDHIHANNVSDNSCSDHDNDESVYDNSLIMPYSNFHTFKRAHRILEKIFINTSYGHACSVYSVSHKF